MLMIKDNFEVNMHMDNSFVLKMLLLTKVDL